MEWATCPCGVNNNEAEASADNIRSASEATRLLAWCSAGAVFLRVSTSVFVVSGLGKFLKLIQTNIRTSELENSPVHAVVLFIRYNVSWAVANDVSIFDCVAPL